ncbi:MAG: hypothetical protein RSB55_01675 [Oscillospiraceae bacterium]
MVSITTATYAWFTLTNSTVVHNMTVEVSTGTVLRASTVFSTQMNDYKGKIENTDIDAQMKTTFEPDLTLASLKLLPVSSGDGAKMYTQAQNTVPGAPAIPAQRGCYMEYTLWFMSDKDTNVYLNGSDSPGVADDGTKVYSDAKNVGSQVNVEKAVRLSFEAYHTASGATSGTATDYKVLEKPAMIYEPNKDKTGVTLTGCALDDYKKLPGATGSTQNTFVNLGTNLGVDKDGTAESPFLFSLKAEVPTRVVLRMWVEGEDPQCKNDNTINIERAKVITRLRFCGADDKGNYME